MTLDTLANKIKAIGVILAFIVGASALIVKYYRLPDDVAKLAAEQAELRQTVDKLVPRVDVLEKRIGRREQTKRSSNR